MADAEAARANPELLRVKREATAAVEAIRADMERRLQAGGRSKVAVGAGGRPSFPSPSGTDGGGQGGRSNIRRTLSSTTPQSGAPGASSRQEETREEETRGRLH